MIRDKKGSISWLAEDTLKIVLAILVVIVLVWVLTEIYYSRINSEKLKQAKSILIDSPQSIKLEIQSLANDENTDFHLQSPQSWYLFSFTHEKKPNSCLNQNCMCICDNVIDISDRQIKECDKSGVCLKVGNLIGFEEIKIDKQFIKIENIEWRIIIR